MTMGNTGTLIMQVLIIAAIMFAIQSALSSRRHEDFKPIRHTWGDGTLPKPETVENQETTQNRTENENK